MNALRNAMMMTLLPMLMLGSVTFNELDLSQTINPSSIDAVNSSVQNTNGVLVVLGGTPSSTNLDSVSILSATSNVNGITFEVVEDGNIDFRIGQDEEVLNLGDPLSRIRINGQSLLSRIDDVIASRYAALTPSSTTNAILYMVDNPLWGRKLAVIGDSLITSPTVETSYPYYIAKRNNMVLVHKGRGGEKLKTDRDASNPSCIKSYTNDIPSDADFILCQIGANDTWDSTEEAASDTDMTTNTFKGCWNNLLIGLKKNYPNAKIGMILANNWMDNIGTNSEDAINYNTRRQMTQWQKVQCQRLNIPVFDPQQDTRMFTYLYKSYATNSTITETSIPTSQLDWYDRTKVEIGTDNSWYRSSIGAWVFQTQYMKDTQHTSAKGNILLSYFYENWMKTVLIAQ